MQYKDLAALAVVLSVSACGTADAPPSRPGALTAPTIAGGGAGTVGNLGLLSPTSGTFAPVLTGTSGAQARAGTGAVGSTGTAGVPSRGSAGQGAAGRGTTGGQAGAPTPTPTGSGNPTIPAVSGDCPEFVNGTITFMGLGGITISAGPKPAEATAPMVFYWHGTGSTSGEYVFMATDVNAGVVAEGGVLVSFQDTTGGDLLSGTAIFGAGDFKLADQLLACAVKNHNVDPHRVFATGCSAGGLFSAAMAASRSSYIAAAAPNSGGWTVPVAFENKHTPALMTIHGAPGVDVVGIDFSDSSATADKAFKAAGGFVINCNHGGMHCGGGGLAPDIWKFFKAHPFGVTPEPWSALPAGFSSQCMIF